MATESAIKRRMMMAAENVGKAGTSAADSTDLLLAALGEMSKDITLGQGRIVDGQDATATRIEAALEKLGDRLDNTSPQPHHLTRVFGPVQPRDVALGGGVLGVTGVLYTLLRYLGIA